MIVVPDQKDLQTVTRQWLTALGIKTNAHFTKREINTHPQFPAITALADFLDAGKMDYHAVEADASYIKEFNYPLLAHIDGQGGGGNLCISLAI